MNPTQGKGFNLSLWAINHPALTRYLMEVLIVLGVAAYFSLGQDEDPPFTFMLMVVRTYWPGATAQQVAEQVTDKLERSLQEAPYADKIRSYSKPGESQIIFQIKDNSKPGEVSDVWYTVRKKIGDMRHTLPQGVQGPFFNDDFGDVYGVIYGLQADGYTNAEAKVFADSVRQQLLRVKDVAKVELFGVQDEKIYIEVSQKRMSQWGLDMAAVVAQIGQQNAVESAGLLQTPLDVVQIRVAGQFEAVEQLRLMPIRGSSGQHVKLGDVAQIRRGYVEPATVKVKPDPTCHLANEPALGLHRIGSLREDRVIRPATRVATLPHKIHDGHPERPESIRKPPPAGPGLIVVEQGIVWIEVWPLARRLLSLEGEHPHQMRPQCRPVRGGPGLDPGLLGLDGSPGQLLDESHRQPRLFVGVVLEQADRRLLLRRARGRE